MSPRPFLFALPAVLLSVGCGGMPPTSGRFGLEMYLERAVADELGAFQVVVLPDGRSRQCTQLQSTCLESQVRLDEPLMLRGPDGSEGHALVFDAALLDGAQDISVEVPVGRDYALVIEALSRTTPPSFLGSSCNYLPEVNPTHNEKLLAAPIKLTVDACDPTFPP